jgi:hypothetical protein
VAGADRDDRHSHFRQLRGVPAVGIPLTPWR